MYGIHILWMNNQHKRHVLHINNVKGMPFLFRLHRSHSGLICRTRRSDVWNFSGTWKFSENFAYFSVFIYFFIFIYVNCKSSYGNLFLTIAFGEVCILDLISSFTLGQLEENSFGIGIHNSEFDTHFINIYITEHVKTLLMRLMPICMSVSESGIRIEFVWLWSHRFSLFFIFNGRVFFIKRYFKFEWLVLSLECTFHLHRFRIFNEICRSQN